MCLDQVARLEREDVEMGFTRAYMARWLRAYWEEIDVFGGDVRPGSHPLETQVAPQNAVSQRVSFGKCRVLAQAISCSKSHL